MTTLSLLRRLAKYDADITHQAPAWNGGKWSGRHEWHVRLYEWEHVGGTIAQSDGQPSLFAALRDCARQVKARKR